ncbi:MULTISPECIES: hypothetical protein [unclassified Pseudoalteromonas]|uniref:hypothetical protein n=1 Tax=Pseudoalteromonas sp. '520P1 No. 412' TaxID=304208 RepID=UPI000B21F715
MFNNLPKHSVASITEKLKSATTQTHAPRVLVLYGSLREGFYSKKLALESAKILT